MGTKGRITTEQAKLPLNRRRSETANDIATGISANRHPRRNQHRSTKEGEKKRAYSPEKNARSRVSLPGDDPRDDRYFGTRAWVLAEIRKRQNELKVLPEGETRSAVEREIEQIRKLGAKALTGRRARGNR